MNSNHRRRKRRRKRKGEVATTITQLRSQFGSVIVAAGWTCMVWCILPWPMFVDRNWGHWNEIPGGERNRDWYNPGCQWCNCARPEIDTLLHVLSRCLSAICSACCGYCCSRRRPNISCGDPDNPGRNCCEHPECLGRWGGVQLWPYGQGDHAPCILGVGHSGLCLCAAHAPTILVDIQVYRPLLGPA